MEERRGDGEGDGFVCSQSVSQSAFKRERGLTEEAVNHV